MRIKFNPGKICYELHDKDLGIIYQNDSKDAVEFFYVREVLKENVENYSQYAISTYGDQIISQVAIGDKQQNILYSYKHEDIARLEDDYRHTITVIYLAKSIINDYWHKSEAQVPLELDKDLYISFNDYAEGRRLLQIIPSNSHECAEAETIIEALEQGYNFIDKDDYVWYSQQEALNSIENIVNVIKNVRDEIQTPADQISSITKEMDDKADKKAQTQDL